MDGVYLMSRFRLSNGKTCSSAVTRPKRAHSPHCFVQRFGLSSRPPRFFLFLRSQRYKVAESRTVMEVSWHSESYRVDWKLNECQRDRPYSFEQTTPTLDELVGISNFQNYLATTYSDPGGDKSPRADLSNMSHLLTRPICIEDDNQRGVEVIKSATAELDSSAFDSTSIEGSDSNVLLTRAERHQYKSLGVPQTERGRGYAGRGDATRCDTHLHSSKNVVGSLSEVFTLRFPAVEPYSTGLSVFIAGKALVTTSRTQRWTRVYVTLRCLIL